MKKFLEDIAYLKHSEIFFFTYILNSTGINLKEYCKTFLIINYRA